MNQSMPILTLTFTAGGIVAEKRFVKPDATQATAGANTVGAAYSAAAASGDKFAVTVLGTASLEAGAAFTTAGMSCRSDSVGRAVPDDSVGVPVGIALETASAAGNTIEVLLIPNVA